MTWMIPVLLPPMLFFFVLFFLRQGQKCSQQELGASALLTVALDDSLGQKATQVIQRFDIPMLF